MSASFERTFEESCALLDIIVGRCIRDLHFAEQVLDDPKNALEPYHLTEDELEDFIALKRGHAVEAGQTWSSIRERMNALKTKTSTT